MMGDKHTETHECMKHQDIAKALGLSKPSPQDMDRAKRLGWRPGDPETGSGRGWPLVYFGLHCPLCEPREALMEEVRRTTLKYRESK